MHRYKVSGDERSRDLNGDFRSLGSSGIFEALPGSRYGSCVDLTSETGARPRALPRALQPKTVKDPQQQRSFSYRHPVVALPPPRAPVTRGLASSSESAEGFRSQGYGNRGDRSLGNQNSGSHVLLASRPASVQNQSAIARRNSASTFDHVTSATPGTAQADAQAQWIERRVVLKGGGVQSRGTAERENGTGRRNNDDDVGYRSVPLSNFRNRRNSSSDLDPMSKSSAPNAYVTCSKATISLAMPRSTRYGSLFDLSKDCGPTTEGGKGGGGGRQTGSDVIGDGLFPRSSSGIGRNGTSGLSKDPDEEPVFGSSSSSFSSSNAREYRNPDASGSGGHVTGKTLNRRFENAVGRSPGTPVVVKRLENWNKAEKTTPGDVTSDDRLTYGNGPPSSLAFRSRKFSFDQSTLPQKQNDFRSYPTSRGPAMMTSLSGPPKPPEAKAPPPPAPWARASAVPGLFGERSQSTTTLSRYPRGSSSAGGDLDSSTALLALRSSRYPSAQMTDGDGDLTMSASERLASSPWTARGAAPSESGEKNRGHHHHHHHHHLHQSPGQRVSSTDFPVESRSGSSASPDFQEVDDVINGRRYSSVVSCAPVTSEETGNRKDRFHSTAPPPAHDVIDYSTAPSHVASSLYDVSGDDSSNYPASEISFAHRMKDNASLDLGDMAARKSSSPMPLPSFTWQIPRRNSLPVVALERKEDTTKTRERGRGRGGGNYESIFSKGDWINAARMTWKSPSVTGSPVAERKPASFSTDGPGSFHDDWKTPSQSESSSANNKMTSALPVEKSETFEKSKKAGENVVQNYSRNSKYLHESGGADPHSDSRISGERVASGIRESDRQWSDAIFREKSTTEEDSLAFGERGEAVSKGDSKTADWMESQQNTEPIEATRSHLERPNPAHDSQRTPEDNCQSEISVPGSTKSSDSTGNDVNSTVLTSEQSDATLNLRDTSIVIHRVESDAGSRSPASREPARTRHLNFKEWYYGGLERTSTTDADQSYCATQVSDHESGYQSSGPTLDDLPPRKPNTADRRAVHREEIPSEDPEYSARIFQNGCDSNAENKASFMSANGSSSVVEKTFENGDNGRGKCHVPAADSSGSGRNPESGGPRELEVPVRASPLGVGFSIEGGRGSTSGDRPIIVKKIFTGGDHLSDKLKPGDAIVRVNDKDFTRLTHYEAWNYLKTLPEGPATFHVHTN